MSRKKWPEDNVLLLTWIQVYVVQINTFKFASKVTVGKLTALLVGEAAMTKARPLELALGV